jgi:hypothetical protein
MGATDYLVSKLRRIGARAVQRMRVLLELLRVRFKLY